MSEHRAVFLDRDGTLMEEVDYCNDPATVEAIPGAGQALSKLRKEGWLTIIVTNQSGLSKGFITLEQYEAVNAELLRQLGAGIDAIYFCADHPDHPTERRKPRPGMLREAATSHGIDLSRSWMIGDKAIDIECGQNAGCQTILVRTGYGLHQSDSKADFIVDNITLGLELILEQHPSQNSDTK